MIHRDMVKKWKVSRIDKASPNECFGKNNPKSNSQTQTFQRLMNLSDSFLSFSSFVLLILHCFLNFLFFLWKFFGFLCNRRLSSLNSSPDPHRTSSPTLHIITSHNRQQRQQSKSSQTSLKCCSNNDSSFIPSFIHFVKHSKFRMSWVNGGSDPGWRRGFTVTMETRRQPALTPLQCDKHKRSGQSLRLVRTPVVPVGGAHSARAQVASLTQLRERKKRDSMLPSSRKFHFDFSASSWTNPVVWRHSWSASRPIKMPGWRRCRRHRTLLRCIVESWGRSSFQVN